ncbi:hypothetical protein QTP88_008654 [Uroleucon formosanum]
MSFISIFRENVAAIKALGVDYLSVFLLFYIGTRALDTDTRRLFKEHILIHEIPKLDNLLDFVAHRCKILENSGFHETKQVISSSVPKKSKGDRSSGKTSLAATTTTKTVKCSFCELGHAIYRCFVFKRISVTERREFVAKKKLYFICLSVDHIANACQSAYRCKSCNGRHHILLHIDNRHVTSTNIIHSYKSGTVVGKSEGRSSSPSFSGTSHSDIRVVLATALIRIRDISGADVLIRVLLDSGSQVSAITTECAKRLGLTRFKTQTEVVGLAQQRVKPIKSSTSYDFVPLTTDESTFTATNVTILNKITTLMPNKKLPNSVRKRYGHLQLADPDFDTPGPIDMLIGGDLYPLVLCTRSEVIHSPGLPSALNTQLEWVVIGVLKDSVTLSAVSLVSNTTPAIDEIMQKFWAVGEPHGSIISTTEDEMCERWFKRTVSRDAADRCKAALPFKIIMTSRSLALNRLYNLERRLSKDSELYEAYRKFMEEYITLGHMKLATREGIYFIPHHVVVKHQETDLKIRVVFDASAVSSSGLSLNDCLRFIDRCKNRNIETGVLSWVETDRALMVAIKKPQNVHWAQLQKQLKSSSTNITPTNLAQFSPFLDIHGVIRMGGRLHYSLLSEDFKHPVLLRKTSHLTELVILHNHLNLLHAGLKLTMTMIFRRFWIMSGRAAIRQVIHACIPCVRYRAACPQPKMATLPAWRVQPHRPFTFVEIDYGGLFTVKESRRRNSRTNKAYLVLFICLSVKAIHLEIASDISTEAFLAAFDRFTARRGIPYEIHSDCDTNDVGAARKLKVLFKEEATQEALNSKTECQWKFNPPTAPHFEGIWEEAIKSSKTRLKKVIGSQVFTMERLTTLVIRIEGILNSRPISALSSDPNDVSALTPGHFLIGQPLAAIASRNVFDISMNRLNRWQLIQQAQQSFWKLWSHEYLHTLQGRQK